MILRRIEFKYLGVEIDVHPAIIELNPVYKAACKAWVQPLAWAQQAGKLSDGAADAALMRAYAEGVIVGSPHEELGKLDSAGWLAWLQDHPQEWQTLRGICESPQNFLEASVGDARGSGSATAGSG